MEYSNYKNVNLSSWKTFIDNHRDSNIFHSVEFSAAIDKLDNCKTILLSQEKEGKILALAVGYTYSEFSNNLYKSLTQRALFQGGILFSKEADVSSFLNKLSKLCKNEGAIYSNIIQFSKNEFDFKSIHSLNYDVIPAYNYIFNLEKGIDPIWNNFKSKKRQNIRKAIKNGLVVKEGNIENLNEVYSCISYTYKKLNIPLFNFVFLEKIYKELSNKNMSKVFLATLDDKIIAIRISLYFNNKAYDWYAGSYDGYNKYYANDVLVWESLKEAEKNNCIIFDFGGAGVQEQEYGVRDFKSKFGGDLKSILIYKNVHYPILNKFLQISKKMQSLIKQRLLNGGK